MGAPYILVSTCESSYSDRARLMRIVPTAARKLNWVALVSAANFQKRDALNERAVMSVPPAANAPPNE